MSRYDGQNIGEIVKTINMSGASAALSQLARTYDTTMMKEVSSIARNSFLIETQKKLSGYNEILKPLHMKSFSVIGKIVAEQTALMGKYDYLGIKNLTENVSSILGKNVYNISGTISTLNQMMESLKSSVNFSEISELTTSMPGLPTILQEVGRGSLVSEILKNNSTFSALSQKTLEDVNIILLGRVTDQVFSESEEWDIDTVSETISMEYEKEMDISSNKDNQSMSIAEKRKVDIKEIREWLSLIITLLSFVLSIMNSSSTTINNYAQQINNYYVVGMGYDAKELNMTKYRIVNRECSVRLKHDFSSIVIENLDEGQVVRIIDKYKKWRQIVWVNEGGEECMGWIQNYKLSEFKIPKNKW